MKYTLLFLRRAQKELSKVPLEYLDNISSEIEKLSENPCIEGAKKLVARSGWRIRIGNFRVIYEIDHRGKTVTVIHIGMRKDIYRVTVYLHIDVI
jgi:mRNA interferase RelE/StbE